MDPIPWDNWPDRLWGFGMTTGGHVNFCVGALLRDGLRVAPFERHAEGVGRLRAAGMTWDQWRGWYERVLGDDVLRETRRLLGSGSSSSPPVDAARSAVELWDGPDAVRTELASMPPPGRPEDPPSDQFRPIRGDRDDRSDPLWSDLQQFRGRVPHFWVYLVRYPFIVADAVRPAAIVMSDRVPLNPALFRATLIDAVRRLA